MSLTRTWPISIDTLLAKSGSTPLGGGNDEHLPIGIAGSYNCKAALKFTHDWSGVTRVISARLYMRTTTKVHATSWGASPSIYVERQTTGNFQENSGRSSYDSPAGSGWSTAASDFDSANVQPTGVDRVTWTPGNNESTWYSVDITAMANSWAPASVLRSDGVTPGGNATNYGLLIRPTANATSETIEFYSRKSAYDPYIVLTYESNTAPNAPTSPSPASGSTIASLTPTLSFLYDDPQGDASSKYHVQVATDAGFTSLIFDSLETALVQADNTVMSVVETNTLTRGVTYYWRAATLDTAGLKSAWSSTWTFIVNSLPTATLIEPSGTGRIAKLLYPAGSGWTAPRMYVQWTYSDAQGQAQSDYELEVVTDNAGAPTGTVIRSGVVTSALTDVTVPGTLVENTRYHVRVRVKDGLEWSAWSGWFIVRARWGYTRHRKDVSIAGVAPTTWSISSVGAAPTATQAVVVEYNSSDDASDTNLGAWQATLGAVTKRKFFQYRVWFLTWGTSPAALPALTDLTLRASGAVIQPEHWLPSPISSQKGSIELSDRVFGTQSLRMDGDGSPHYITQQVRVEPDEDYVLQGRIRSYGNSGAKVYLSDTQNGPPLTVIVDGATLNVETVPATTDLAWDHRIGRVVWNSGGRSAVWVTVYINGPTGSVGLFDGLKAERGRVTSPWTPGLVGTGVAIDSGGIQIDATNSSGAIFRLRTTGGNVIELGPDTLYLDGVPIGSGAVPYVDNSPPPSPTNGMLWWDDDDATLGGAGSGSGTSFPGSPTIGMTFWRTDLAMTFFWNGTHWLSTTLYFAEALPWSQTFPNGTITVTTQTYNRWTAPYLMGGSDIWVEDFISDVYVNSGGTALAAAHKWVGTLLGEREGTNVTRTTLGTISVDSGTSAVIRRFVTAIDALLNDGTLHTWLAVDWAKTGTPGALSNAHSQVTYRVVAT